MNAKPPLLFALAGLLCVPQLRADDAGVSLGGALAGASGEQIYQQICQGCHLNNGQGAIGAGFYPKLAGDKNLFSWQYAALTILNGRHGMPAFGLPPQASAETMSVHLDDAQIADVVNYLRGHFDNHYKANVTAKKVADLPHPGVASPP